MLTKAEVELLSETYRMPSPTPKADLLAQLDTQIAELQASDGLVISEEVAVTIMSALRELLVRTAPRMATMPLMTGFDPPNDAD